MARRFSRASLRSLLASTHARWAIISLAMLLTSTSLAMGLTGDDYLQTLMLRERSGVQGVEHHTLNLFSFATGEAAQRRGMMQEGLFPWWTDSQIVLSFFRPLSCATHWLDHQLWPERPSIMHLHNMLWLAALLFAAAQVYRRFFLGSWLAGLALLLYAVDDARAGPVAWIANRNALIATMLPLFALLAHDRARRASSELQASGALSRSLLGPLCFALGLLAGEAAVQMLGYLVAYAIYLDPAPVKQRLRSLAPYLAIVVAWRIAYVALGYGAYGSGLYTDPVGHPVAFLSSFVTRLPVLLLAEFALPWSELWDLGPVTTPLLQPGMLLLAAIALPLLTLLFAPLWKRDPLVRFWALGALLATIPACAAAPNDRLLTATGIGGAALIATFLGSLLDRTYPGPTRAVRLAGGAMVFIHLLFAPLMLPSRTKAVDGLELLTARADRSIPSTPDVTEREVVVLNPPVEPMALYFAAARQVRGIPRPRSFRWLASGVSALQLERRDEHTLRVRPDNGFMPNSTGWLVRDPATPSRVGDVVELDDVRIVITALTPDGRPGEVDMRFRESLDSSKLEWMQWGEHEYVPFALPRLGQSALVPAVDMKKAIFGLGLEDR